MNSTDVAYSYVVMINNNFFFAVIRTLTGHKAGIRCLDFHPYGDYIVSGSLDTNIRVIKIFFLKNLVS